MLIKHFKYIFFIKIFFLTIALLMVLFVKSNYYDKTNSKNYDNNIVFMLDISHSMNVNDISKKTRLDISKELIKNKLNTYSGEKKDINVGVILFSNISNYFIPPTNDYTTIKKHLKDINTNYLPNGKTNLSGAINKFVDSSGKGIKGIIVSDLGGIENSFNLKNYKKEIEKKDLSLSVIGVGTESGGYVTYPDKSFISYDGEKVVDKLNENLGKKIVDTYGGNYYKLNSSSKKENINLLKDNNISYKNNKEIKKTLETLIGIFTAIGL